MTTYEIDHCRFKMRYEWIWVFVPTRDWRVFESIFNSTLAYCLRLFSRTAHYKVIPQLQDNIIHIVDSTTIRLCLNLFGWARLRTTKEAIKIHTQLAESSELPVVVYISEWRE